MATDLHPNASDQYSRPIWQVLDCGLAFIAFAAIYKLASGESVYSLGGIMLLGVFLLTIWLVGRVGVIRRFFGIVLSENRQSELRIADTSTGEGNNRATPSQQAKGKHHDRFWWLGGLIFVIGCFTFLELRQPYYFSQDDNLSQFLPTILHGCRSFFDEGVFPTWNPYQFMGAPTASLGTYALTYPPTYAAYAIARFGLQNEYATLEVFCLAHLLVGYAAMSWTCRVMGVRASLTVATGVCFALSGYFLIVGRSWYYMTPVAAFAPLLVGLVERFRRGPVNGTWILATGSVLGAFFHAGNVQMWIYAAMFFVVSVAILFLCSAVPWRHAIAPLSALLIGIAVAMPLLLPQYLETMQAERRVDDRTTLHSLPAMFLPYPVAKASFPAFADTPDVDRAGHLYYSGTVLSVAALMGMFSLVAHRWTRQYIAANVWLLMAWLALLAAIGYLSPIWQLMSVIPPFNGMKHPFKFVAFITLFMLVGGAVLTERILRHAKVRYRTELVLAATIFLLVSYHVWMSTAVICKIGFQPFPALPNKIQALRKQHPAARILPVAAIRGQAPEYALSMTNQLPTVWRWPALFGYDPLVSENKKLKRIERKVFGPNEIDPDGYFLELCRWLLSCDQLKAISDVETFRQYASSAIDRAARFLKAQQPPSLIALQAYGVRWVVVYNGRVIPNPRKHNRFWHVDSKLEQIGKDAKQWGREVVHRREVRIYELENPSPLAFARTAPNSELPSEFTAAGMAVDTSSLRNGGEVVVNVAAATFLTATVDGKTQSARKDQWGRLIFNVPAGTKQLRLAYSPPWLLGASYGALFATLAAVLTLVWRRRVAQRVTPNIDQIAVEMAASISRVA